MFFLPDYFRWHYSQTLKKLGLAFTNLLIFIYHYFSISTLSKTLFAPWKRQLIGKSRPGFHFDDILGTISFNIISRILGSIIRTITIISGIIILVLTFVFGLLSIFIFIFTPFLWLPLYFYTNFKKKPPSQKLLTASKHNLHTLTLEIIKTKEGQFIFTRLGILPNELTSYLKSLYDPGDYDLFKSKLKDFSISDLIISLSQTYAPLVKLLHHYEITTADIEATTLWWKSLLNNSHPFALTDLSSLLRIPGIGRDWAYGFTINLDKYTQDFSEIYTLFPKIVGRDKEITTLEQILSKTAQNSAIVVGEPGVGRHAIIYGLAKLVNNGSCLPALFNKRLLSIDFKLLSSGKTDQLEIKSQAKDLIKEGKVAGNIILVIDNFENYISAGIGKIDLSDVFSEVLSNGSLQVIAITDPSSYHQYILPNPTLTPLFEKIEVEAPKDSVVLEELELTITPVFETKHGVLITYQSLIETIKDAGRFESEFPFPEKAIDLLDEAIVYLKTEKKESVLYPHHIQEFLSRKTHIPIGNLGKLEKEKLANLENIIHQQVINQGIAVSAIADSLRRARAGVSGTDKPIGSFLFLGPTGVGKTETAKALARIYYGSENRILRFDMSQYQGDSGLERLIGSTKTGASGELTRHIRDNPFSLLLLDEIEKADKKIYNLFLTLLDEGYIQDATGKKVDAKNLFIIATSNAGSEFIREQVQKGLPTGDLNLHLIDFIQKEQIFSPEFLNRFDAVIVFTPLSEGHLREVTKLLLAKLNQQLAKQEISVVITPDLVKKLTAAGFDPLFGARAIKRIIAQKVESQIAQKLISGEVKKGDQVKIDF